MPKSKRSKKSIARAIKRRQRLANEAKFKKKQAQEQFNEAMEKFKEQLLSAQKEAQESGNEGLEAATEVLLSDEEE